MKKIFILFFFLVAIFATQAQKQNLALYDLTCEYKKDPIGIDVQSPRLSWKIKSSLRDTKQEAYEISITENNISKNAVWKSGKIISGQNILIPYSGSPLKPNTVYNWRVRVWDKKGNVSSWSATATFETGMMSGAWNAKWIEPEKIFSAKESLPPVYTRKAFKVSKKVIKARYYATARGLYEMYINGSKVSDAVLTPGWTSYNNRLQYQTYDVTTLLKTGDNAVGAILGEGWYRGELAWGGNRNLYGQKLGLLAELHIWYNDGTKEIINTDGTWKANSDGPIIFSGIYDGEIYDARKEWQGWNASGFNDSDWWGVSISDKQQQTLVSQEGPLVKRIDTIKPLRIFKTPKGETVLDMGQNMVGWIRLKLNGNKGDVVKLYHAEILDKSGNFYIENLRSAKQQIQYTLKGEGTEIFEPHFTFQGFRFVKVEGIAGEITSDQIAGIVLHSEMKPTSNFETSSKEINQLQHNIIWGHKGNFVDVPTDCPQRDERLGWTGDAQAFVSTAAFNMDIAPFFTKWMKDIAADQFQNGGVPFVVPDVLRNNETSAGWGDVSVIAPWTIYLMYGDKQVLQQQYASMKKYVEYIRMKSGDSMIWKGGSVFGDWLYYHPGIHDHTTADGHTDRDYISTAFYAYSTSLLSKAAEVLGKKDDAEFYQKLFNKIKGAFIKDYVTSTGRIYSGSQTSYVLALKFNLLPDHLIAAAADYLVQDIRSRGNHLSTGFLGTPYLCQVLTQTGHNDVAYDLLFQRSYPSWLYPVSMGATTIWERWDGMRPDSTFQDVGMNSFNHYAYGAIGDWMYQNAAGIQPDLNEPGYHHFILKPQPGGEFSFVKASHETMYGTILSDWKIDGSKFTYKISIPANTSAAVFLPGAAGKVVIMNDTIAEGVSQNGALEMNLGSGDYEFSWDWKK